MGPLWGCLFWACVLWAAKIPLANAQSFTDRLSGSPNVPWQISADSVSYDALTTTYHASGDVIIEKQTARLVADSVAFNHKAMTALATGHVVLTAGDDVVTGDQVTLDLDRQTGTIHHGAVYLKDNHFIIRGDRIEKTGQDTYQAENASITTCDGENPDWIITGRRVKVTVEGYGTATHAVFRARQVPVLYTPYLLFPAKTKRQTGLLIPEPGYSDRKGFSWDQPFFWAISDDSDATAYANIMEKRGTKIGLEYRWALTGDSFGAVMGDGLDDRQIDDGTPENTDRWGYPGDAYDRPNHDRWWLRAKANQELPGEARARLDLDLVSDQDYLTEFKGGRSGFDESRDYFLAAFGRDLDTYDDDIRTNRLNINRTWSRYTLNGDLRWNDNVVKRRWEETDTTLQQLPMIRFDATKQRALESGLFWDLDSEATYFYREDGDRGYRTDLYPRAYLPLRWKNYLSLEPSAGWRQTYWQMDRWDDEDLDRSNYRQIYDLALDLSTQLSKVMQSPVPGVDRIRHSVKPRVVYTYTPDQDQSDLPNFTKTDRIAEANRVTYSLTNTFTARRPKRARSLQLDDDADWPAEPEEIPRHPAESDVDLEDGKATDWPVNAELSPEGPVDTTGSPDGSILSEDDPLPLSTGTSATGGFDYYRFCRFYLQQSYDIAAAREDDPEPFSAIYGELDVYFSRYVRLDSDARFDIYDNRFTSHNVGAILRDHRGDRLTVAHRYKTKSYESIRSTLSLKATDRLTLRGEYERNLLGEKDIIKGVGFLYTTPCWSVDFFYARETSDERYSFLIHLTGIGGLGR